MADLARIGIEVDTGQVRNATGDLGRMGDAANRTTAGVNILRNAALGFGSVLGAMAIVATTKELIQFADKMTLIDSRLRVATSTTGDYTTARKALLAVSMSTGTSFEANAQIFGRVNKQMESMGGTIQNTISFTKGLAQALRISGASAGETSSVITQMSQALGAGTLRGDEFRSMMENAPRVAQALADGLHKTVGALRAMSMAGELSAKTVVEALQSQSKVLDDEFHKIPLTVGAAMENVRTAFGDYIQTANSASGATSGLAGNINSIATNIIPVVNTATTALKIMAAVFGTQIVSAAMAGTASYFAAGAAMAQLTAVNYAHSQALKIDSEMTLANAQANVLNIESQINLARTQALAMNATLGTITANEASVAAELSLVEARVLQSETALRAMGQTVQSTSVLYLMEQETIKLAAAENERNILTQYGLGLETERTTVMAAQAAAYSKVSLGVTGLTAAQAALAVAQDALIVEAGFLTKAYGVLTAEISFMSVAMAGLNIAMGLFVAYQVREWLAGFTTTQNMAAIAAGGLAQAINAVSYAHEYMVNVFSGASDLNAELTIKYNAQQAAIQDITTSTILFNDAQGNLGKQSAETAAIIESLKTPQDAYNQKIKEAEAELANFNATAGKAGISAETFAKYKAKLDEQLQIQLDSTPLSAYQEEVNKLTLAYKKLTLSNEQYNAVVAAKTFKNAEESAAIAQLMTKNELQQQLNETQKQNTETYNGLIATAQREISVSSKASKAAAAAYDVRFGALNALDEKQKAHLLTLAKEQDAHIAQMSASDAYKAALEEQKQRIDEVTLSENQLYAAKLKNQGLSNQQIQTVVEAKANADKIVTAKTESSSAATTREANQPSAADTQNNITADAPYKPYLTAEEAGYIQINQSQVNNNYGADFAKQQADKALTAIYGSYKQVNEDIGATAQRVADQTKAVMGAGKKASDAMADSIIKAAGGLSSFTSGLGIFNDKFFTATEKAAQNTQSLVNELNTVNAKLPATRDGYKQLVQGLNTANTAEAKRYGVLIKMSAAADTYYTALESISGSTAKAALSIADANKVISDSIAQAKSDLLTAYKSEQSTLQSTIKKLFDFGQGLKAFRDGLVLGDLSPSTNLQKYTYATSQFNDTVNTINAGAGATAESQALYERAVGDLQSKSTAFLNASRVINASSEGYTNDFKRVLAALDGTGGSVNKAATDAQAQLNSLNDVVSGLIDLGDKTLTVKQAIDALNAANAQQNQAIVMAIYGQSTDTSKKSPFSSSPFPMSSQGGFLGSGSGSDSPEVFATGSGSATGVSGGNQSAYGGGVRGGQSHMSLNSGANASASTSSGITIAERNARYQQEQNIYNTGYANPGGSGSAAVDRARAIDNEASSAESRGGLGDSGGARGGGYSMQGRGSTSDAYIDMARRNGTDRMVSGTNAGMGGDNLNMGGSLPDDLTKAAASYTDTATATATATASMTGKVTWTWSANQAIWYGSDGNIFTPRTYDDLPPGMSKSEADDAKAGAGRAGAAAAGAQNNRASSNHELSGSYATGLERVTQKETAVLVHQDEMIPTAEASNQLRKVGFSAKTGFPSGGGSGGDNKDIADLLKQILEISGISAQAIVEAIIESGQGIMQSNKQPSSISRRPEVV